MGRAVVIALFEKTIFVGGVRTHHGMIGVPDEVVADVKVEVAVVIQVGEGGRGGPVAIATEAGAIGDFLESAIPSDCGKGHTIASV
jgi:hypothetical protein